MSDHAPSSTASMYADLSGLRRYLVSKREELFAVRMPPLVVDTRTNTMAPIPGWQEMIEQALGNLNACIEQIDSVLPWEHR